MIAQEDREREFVERIDARFPYNDVAEAAALIREAAGVSPNAAFAVLEEICSPPRYTAVTKTRQLALIDDWESTIEHSLANAVLEFARASVRGKILPVGWALSVMDLIAAQPGQYCALNIVSWAMARGVPADAEAVDRRDDAIRSQWEAAWTAHR